LKNKYAFKRLSVRMVHKTSKQNTKNLMITLNP